MMVHQKRIADREGSHMGDESGDTHSPMQTMIFRLIFLCTDVNLRATNMAIALSYPRARTLFVPICQT
jgi:hypothetical protein